MTAPFPASSQLLDLHNHSDRSYDAANRLSDYERAHEAGRFHVLAITDHNRLDGALHFAEHASFPVIVGMEIDTGEGELIGLFLTEPVAPQRGAPETAEAIRGQGGLVYLQHPFYPLVRKPLRPQVREDLASASLLDIVEVRNGGPFTGRSDQKARSWAVSRGLPVAGSSDAHEPKDIGQIVTAVPPGPLTPQAVLERLREGIIVDRHRSSIAQIATKARYRFFAELTRRARREPRRRRLP
jgi:predicted metal-dependent phosphoesterase TrpH